MSAISVTNLRKSYFVPVRDAGVRAAVAVLLTAAFFVVSNRIWKWGRRSYAGASA